MMSGGVSGQVLEVTLIHLYFFPFSDTFSLIYTVALVI